MIFKTEFAVNMRESHSVKNLCGRMAARGGWQ